MSDRIEAEILDVLGEEVDADVDTPLVVIEGTKGDPGAPGKDGITPTIGDNGNWYLGAEDTGKPSRGETGAQGAPGVYYGTTQPTGDTHPVWINPDGDHDDGGLLPAVTAADNGKVLRVVSSAWSAADMPTGGTDMGITGATVGQIAKITAVDESGVPTAWSPVDMPSGGGGETLELLSDTTIDEDVSVISMAIPPCKKIKAYFEGYQVCSDGSETSTNFTDLIVEFSVDGNQGLRAFYVLNSVSRFNSDVVSVIDFDVSAPPFASGEMNRILPDGQNSGFSYCPVSNEIAITAASAITEIKIAPHYKFVSGVGNVGRFASGGRFRVYGVRK